MLCDSAAARQRNLIARFGGAVRISGIHKNGANPAPRGAQMLAGYSYGRGLYTIGGEDSRGGRRLIRHDQP
jgi:hypothetical protein